MTAVLAQVHKVLAAVDEGDLDMDPALRPRRQAEIQRIAKMWASPPGVSEDSTVPAYAEASILIIHSMPGVGLHAARECQMISEAFRTFPNWFVTIRTGEALRSQASLTRSRKDPRSYTGPARSTMIRSA